MGTRSLLGYELANGKIYYQYLQFDGYPEGQGQTYYTKVLEGIKHLIKSKKLNSQVFTRIKHYLNEVQYNSGHSIYNHSVTTRKEWFGFGIKAWQEWQYLFTRTGDFIFSGGANQVQVLIPWKLSANLLTDTSRFLNHKTTSPWWSASKLDDYDENEKVISWGKDAPLHINEELEWDSSKLLRDKLLKGIGIEKIPLPVFRLTFGEHLCFPEQKNNGYRSYEILEIGPAENVQTINGLFADRLLLNPINQEIIEVQYLTGNKRIKE